MASFNSVIFTTLFLCYFSNGVTSDGACGSDWIDYNQETCLKVYSTRGLVSYEDAEYYCKNQYAARLVTVGTAEKQNFIQKFISTKKEVFVDDIWIGLKYVNNVYGWNDEMNTPYVYKNWDSGSPKNSSDHCVQLQTDETEFGTWSDVPCGKKNVVVCEKLRLWSAIELQAHVMNLMRDDNIYETVLASLIQETKGLQTEVKNLEEHHIPIGFIYVQLPKEYEPTVLWPYARWQDISYDYAGVFFRVLGGNSASFGTAQRENSPRLIHVRRAKLSDNEAKPEVDIYPGRENVPWDAEVSGRSDRGVYFTMSGGETRPRNMAVRVWRRIL